VLVGNKRQEEIDYQVTALGALAFRRTYNNLADHPAKLDTPLGKGWFASYLQSISTPGFGGGIAYAVRPDGSVIGFRELHTGSVVTGYVAVGEVREHLDVVRNASGAFTGYRYTTANDDVETYNTSGQLLSMRSRAGVVLTMTYDSLFHLTSVVDSFGHSITLQWLNSSFRRLLNIKDAAGQTISFGYDVNNNLTSVTYPDQKQRIYLYELTGSAQRNLLTGLKDESGTRLATWTYGANNVVTSSEHAGGVEHYGFTYNADGSRLVVDPIGTSHTYNTALIAGQRRYAASDLPCEGSSEFAAIAYDASGNFASTRDFKGVETHYSFDQARTLELSRTEAYGTPKARTVTTSWHPSFRLPAEIDEPGRSTTFAYDASGNVLNRTVTDTATSTSRTWSYTYNSFGQVLTEDGPRTDVSDTTTYSYYACSSGSECGQLQTIANALGQVTTYNTYNAHAQPLTITDSNGVVTTLAYDLRQRLTSRQAVGETTAFEYWPAGLLKKVTQPDGSFLLYTYDNAQRLVQIQDSEGNHIDLTLDAMGNVTAENVRDSSGALALTHTRVINSLNQFWKDIKAAGTSAVTTTFAYDGNGNLTSANAPLARNTANLYDELNRLKQVTDAASGTTQFGYDANDNLTSVTDPRSLLTTYAYNAFGDLKTQTSPDSGVTQYAYDSGGNLHTRTDARGKTGTFTYDALDRLTQLSYPDQTITYQYDQGSNGIGRRTAMSDAISTTTWTYDALGRVLSKQQTVDGGTQNIQYQYTAGRLTRIGTPGGHTIDYTYQNGRIRTITRDGQSLLHDVLYEPFGPVRGWTWASGMLTNRAHDLDGRVTSINSAGLVNYAYDNAGRITGLTDMDDASRSWTYGYDLLDRLTTGNSTAYGALSFGYDANGNRLSLGIASNSNRLVSQPYGSGTVPVTSDAMGNVLSDALSTKTYDDAGRLHSVGSATTYSHNALGQRTRRGSFGYFDDLYLFDESGRLISTKLHHLPPWSDFAQDYTEEETVWLEDVPVGAWIKPSEADPTAFDEVHSDHLNAPRALKDAFNGVTVWRWDNDNPFFTGWPHEDVDGDNVYLGYSQGPPGMRRDLPGFYNYFRDYDPAIGRYAESDPIGLKAGVNTYGYVGGNPISRRDPFGLMCTAGLGCYTTPAEAAAAQSGNYQGYYQLACAGGDAYACYAEHIAADDNASGHAATWWLKRNLKKVADANKQCINEEGILNQIRQDLAKDYAKYLPTSPADARWPSALDISQIHWDEFGKYGLPPSAFGGTPLGSGVGPILPGVWCPNCSP